MNKEQQLFKEALLQRGDFKEEEFELNKFGDFSWIGTDDAYGIWELCAESKQAEINDLKAKLEAAQVHEGFVLVPKEPTLKMSAAYEVNSIAPISSLSVQGYKAMIEAAQGEGHE